jgi:glycosyltransferase involved in cell wall biosynthesis
MLMAVIAYLAPEIPALSATFVYEELLGLERAGFAVVPVSVRAPETIAPGQTELAARTFVLYGRSRFAAALLGACSLTRLLGGLPKALSWLASDMFAVGLLSARSWKLAFHFLAAGRLARHLLGERCVHLHVHFAHTPAQLAMYASALCGVPFTITAHANDIFERGLLLPRKAQRARILLTVSEYNRRHLLELGVPAEKLAVVRCGPSLAPAEPRPQARPAVFRLGTLGRLVEKKGMDIVLRALAELHRAQRPVALRVAGDGPQRGSLQALARTLGVEHAVGFEGSIPHPDVAAWLRGLDCFVLACRVDARGDMDGIPVVLMEAMSQGVPVVSTRLSGIPELVVDEETGLLAHPGDAVGLASQIARVLDSPERRQALTARARAHVAHEFGFELNLRRLVGHFGLVSWPPATPQ